MFYVYYDPFILERLQQGDRVKNLEKTQNYYQTNMIDYWNHPKTFKLDYTFLIDINKLRILCPKSFILTDPFYKIFTYFFLLIFSQTPFWVFRMCINGTRNLEDE